MEILSSPLLNSQSPVETCLEIDRVRRKVGLTRRSS